MNIVLKILSIQQFCTNNVGVGTMVDGGFAEYVIIDVNCNWDCPFRAAFGKGAVPLSVHISKVLL